MASPTAKSWSSNPTDGSPTRGTHQAKRRHADLKAVVTWTLTPTKDGVLVRMEQSGFRPEEEANYQGANYGWQRFVGNLERVAGRLT
jgi:uncharacterized protein YndB with AHSA1/START domain